VASILQTALGIASLS